MTKSVQTVQAGDQFRSLRQILTKLSYAFGFELKQLPPVDNNGSRFWLVQLLVVGVLRFARRRREARGQCCLTASTKKFAPKHTGSGLGRVKARTKDLCSSTS